MCLLRWMLLRIGMERKSGNVRDNFATVQGNLHHEQTLRGPETAVLLADEETA